VNTVSILAFDLRWLVSSPDYSLKPRGGLTGAMIQEMAILSELTQLAGQDESSVTKLRLAGMSPSTISLVDELHCVEALKQARKECDTRAPQCH
jgi:hypothetical protein